jgi:hypothetical protein
MSKTVKIVLAIIGGVLLLSVAVGVWVWYDLRTNPANERIQAAVREMAAEEPRLRPAYDQFMSDGKLTTVEALEFKRQADALRDK